MKKSLFILLLTISAAVAFGQSCITCDENTINFENGASAIGTQNLSTGINSLAVGYQCEALGDYSIAMPFLAKSVGNRSLAFGYNAIARDLSAIAIGENTEASWMYSVAIGRSNKSTGVGAVSLGYMNHADANFSFLFGRNLKTQASNSMAIGVGSSETLTNGIPNSLMVGFNSDVPTFFVETSPEIGRAHV